MNALIFGIAVTVSCLFVALAGLWLVRRTVGHESLKVNHEVAAVMISVLGTLYAVVLGMVVVDALAHREMAEVMESTEANALAGIMHLCRTLPIPVRKKVYQAELDYLELTTVREWQKLQDGTAPDMEARDAFGKVWVTVASYEPRTSREQNIHASLLSAVTQLADSRRYRIVGCKQGLPSLLWLVLITGGVCTIGFTYFFGAEKLTAQMVMTAIVTLMLCLNILLVYFYGRPYSGDLHVEPHNLIHVRDLLRNAPILQKGKKESAPADVQTKSEAESKADAATDKAPADKAPADKVPAE